MPKPPSPFFFHVSLFTMMEICERVRVCVCPCISLSTLYNKQCLLLARFCAFLPSFFTFCCCYSCCWCVWVHQHNGNIQSESINEAVQCSHLTICFLYTFAHTHTHTRFSRHFFLSYFFVVVVVVVVFTSIWENSTEHEIRVTYVILAILMIFRFWQCACVCATNNTDKRDISNFFLKLCFFVFFFSLHFKVTI